MKAAKKALALLLAALMLFGFGAGVSAEASEKPEPQAYAQREADDVLEDLDEEIQEDVSPEPTEPSWLERIKDGFKLDRHETYELVILFLWPLILVLALSDGIFGHYIGMIPFLISLPITLPVSLVLGIITMPILLLLRSSSLGPF